MARLFIFAIGGTGSRVLRSLTMLLASGITQKTDNTYEIVPIIIDPHKANEDLKRTLRVLDTYQSITEEVGINNGFFNTRISTLQSLAANKQKFQGSFTFDLQEVSNSRFRDYIGYNTMDKPNQALANLLFSGQSINKRGEDVDLLDIEMDIGFVGNPNVGSVVLNQFKDSDEFKQFASSFNEDDRIFIISSIFGGTGAAGFPTILKNIRGAMGNSTIDSKGFLQDSKIGALTVLPYFNVEKDESSPIQTSDFIAKTKAALHYYKDNVTGNQSVNALYYIADSYNGKSYKNDPGDGGQKNDAHFVELASALAIIDFMGIPDRQLQTAEGRAINPIYKEFGTKADNEALTLLELGNQSQDILNLRLSQFFFFHKYMQEKLTSSIDKQAWSTDSPEIKKAFLSTAFYKNYIADFFSFYDEWLEELARNRRGFSPFNIKSNLEASIKGIEPEKGWFKDKVDYGFYDNKLNSISKGRQYASSSEKLIKLFFEATDEILTKKFAHFKVKA
ncbi:hypothetical protein [uncultured Pontibacter sp.]|uniref:hypothetical protein n=1 Tax=uncultured Pontibacter sp. TaxID=453356 RepID=UPI0026342BE9|nr:hypothetical protein [uncultured Pontibacter sp.]